MNLRRACLSPFVTVMAVLAFMPMATAQELQLSGADRWVVVASSQDADTAIGIAALYARQSSRVVRSRNRWYGIVFGPVRAATIEAFRSGYRGWPGLPSDDLLSRGANYVETVWTPPAPVMVNRSEIGAGGGASLRVGTLAISTTGSGAEGDPARIVGMVGPRRVFDLPAPADYYSDYGAELKAVRLDNGTRHRQIVLTRFSGGAHCCTATWILSERGSGGWSFTEGGELDGGGYAFQDIDQDGAAELISVDNSFHYAFDSYAAGNPPLRIASFAGSRLTDVSASPLILNRYRQEAAGMEFLAKVNPELWRSNGFLAGWVATKARIGQFDEAWTKMITLFDRDNTFGLLVCPDGSDNCGSDRMVTLPFPDGLARHLEEQGYTPRLSPVGAGSPSPGAVGGEVSASLAADTCFEETDCRSGQCDIAIRIGGDTAQLLLNALKQRVTVDPRMADLGLALYTTRESAVKKRV